MSVYAGQGASVKIGATALAQVVEITGPAMAVGTTETTNLASTIKTRRAQLPDPGTISATIQYDPADATHTALTTLIGTWPQAPSSCEVDFPVAAHKATFSAVLTKFEVKGLNEDDNMEADIELQVTGAIVWS